MKNKKIIFIILGALLVLALMFLLWFWFFGRERSDVLPSGGNYGSATDATGLGSSGEGEGNGQTPIDTAGGGQQTGSTNTNGSGGGIITGSGGFITASSSGYWSVVSPSGVSWVGGIGGGAFGGRGNGFSFGQTPINDINNSTVSGSPQISTITGADGSQVSLLSSLLTLAFGCIASYTIQEGIIGPATTAISTGLSSAGNFLASLFGFNVSGTTPLNPTYTSDITEQQKTSTQTVSQCLARTLGRLAVQKITDSVVEWINGGFNGQPSFVQDYNKFFTDVADQAAGKFIEGSDLAFLCSPFQLKVKIAIAQSYASRNSGSAASCTLSQVVGNIDGFMRGDWAQGGWQGFISLTTEPTNNAYGAYLYGQSRLRATIQLGQQNAAFEISPGGFLAQKQCTGPLDLETGQRLPPCKIVTPGSTIEASLTTALGADVQELALGESIDQILGALSNALITKLLYSGLSNVNTSNTSTSGPTSEANALMRTIQGGVSAAQQYAGVKQRTIADIQTAQQNAATLANCWAIATSTPGATQAQIAQGTAGFDQAFTTISNLEIKVGEQNAKIVAANTSIAKLQEIQTDLLLATTPANLTAVKNKYQALVTAGSPHIYTAADVTSASQDRETIQGQLAVINQTTSQALTQCYALR
jgi:hypothetical protein